MKTQLVAVGLLALLVPGAIAQDAAARKTFAQTVREGVVKKPGSNIAPGFNITTDGPDATIYVLHIAGMTYANCQGVFTAEAVSELKAVGFTQYVCTDDGNARFVFDLSSSSAGAGPFGFEKGMKQSEVISLVGRGAVDTKFSGDPDRLVLTTAPKPHPAFDGYILLFSPKDGLIKIAAVGKSLKVDAHGTELKQAFNDVVEGMSPKYGSPEIVDIPTTKLFREPDEWMMAIYHKDRALAAYWLLTTPNNHISAFHITAIALDAVGVSSDKGYVGLKFEFEGFPDYNAHRKAREDESY
jgi:hypothetical protein